MNIPIVYEDDYLLIVNKPSGLLTIPTPKNEKRTLNSILNDDLKLRNLSYRLHPCHRLDRETSGLVIFAKGKSIQKKMMDLFKERKVKKTYAAFVKAGISKPSGAIKNRIEGSTAETHYKVIEKRRYFDIVEVMPVTGRTNQIRIHFKQINHPILGETKFAFRRDFEIRAKRLCLHAKELEFRHPVVDSLVRASAEIPPDMRFFLETHKA